MGAHVGAVAALATAVFWTITALAFEYAANRIGSLLLNFLRLVVGFLFLGLWCSFTQGSFLPLSAPPSAWLWLSASGIIGFVVGDFLLFQGFIDIGSRISMLIYASAPALTAVLGFGILGERLAGPALLGMALTLAGIAIVVLSPREKEDPPEKGRVKRNRARGVLCAFGGALGQAAGLILSKIGAGTMDPFAGTEIRVSAGIIGFILVLSAAGAWRGMGKALRDAKSLGSLSVGSFFGPFLGVSLSLLAVQSMQAGIAAAIMSIVPVLIIAPSAILNKERIRVRDVAGSAIAVFGVFVLFVA